MLKVAIVIGFDDFMNDYYQIIDEQDVTHVYCETVAHAYEYAKENNMEVVKVNIL